MNLTLREKVKALISEHGPLSVSDMIEIRPELSIGSLAAMVCRMRDSYQLQVAWRRVIRADGQTEPVYDLTAKWELLPEERLKKALENGPKLRQELSKIFPNLSKNSMGSLLESLLAAGSIKKQKTGKYFYLYRLASDSSFSDETVSVRPLSRQRQGELAAQKRAADAFERFSAGASLYDRLFGDYVRAKGGRT